MRLSENYSVSDVRVLESGIVSTQSNQRTLTRGGDYEFRAEDFVITPISEEKAKTRALTTGEAGADGKSVLHVGTGIAFFVWYCGDLVKEILKDNWTPCEKTVGGGLF